MGMTGRQQQQHSTPQQAVLADCQRYSIQDTVADSKLIALDSGIAAFFFEPDDNECGHVKRMMSHQP